jgi:hypothetical protein
MLAPDDHNSLDPPIWGRAHPSTGTAHEPAASLTAQIGPTAGQRLGRLVGRDDGRNVKTPAYVGVSEWS